MKKFFYILEKWGIYKKDLRIFVVILSITEILCYSPFITKLILSSSLFFKVLITPEMAKFLAICNTGLCCMPITIFFGLWWNHGELSIYLARIFDFFSLKKLANTCKRKIIDRGIPGDIVQIFLFLALGGTYSSLLKNIYANNVLNLVAEVAKYLCYALPYIVLLKYSKKSIKKSIIYVLVLPLLFAILCSFFHLYVGQNKEIFVSTFWRLSSTIVLGVFKLFLCLSKVVLHAGYYKMIPEIRRIWNGKKCSNSTYLYTIACFMQPMLQCIIIFIGGKQIDNELILVAADKLILYIFLLCLVFYYKDYFRNKLLKKALQKNINNLEDFFIFLQENKLLSEKDKEGSEFIRKNVFEKEGVFIKEFLLKFSFERNKTRKEFEGFLKANNMNDADRDELLRIYSLKVQYGLKGGIQICISHFFCAYVIWKCKDTFLE